MVSRGIELLNGEWLVLMRCHAADVRLVGVCGNERLDGERLGCDATDECLVRALVIRASSWGLAGFDVIGVAP